MSKGVFVRSMGAIGVVAVLAAAYVGMHRQQRVTAARNAMAEPAHRQAVPVAPSPPTGRASQAALPSFPMAIELTRQDGSTKSVRLCQMHGGLEHAAGPADGVICGVDCRMCVPGGGEPHWDASHPIPWEVFAQGEYVGPARVVHMPEYRLRVDDILEITYWFTHEASDESYRFEVGDQIMIESLTDANLNRGTLDQGRGLTVQPDGTITVRLLGQVPAAGRSVDDLREALENSYLEYYKVPSITVTPLKTNARLEALRSSIDARFGTGGQVRRVQIIPEGTVQLPGLSSTQAHGLSISELEREVEERYIAEFGPGVNVTVSLFQRAPRFVYVLGEVTNPGQFTLQQPTSVIQALALAGDYNIGANLREVVVMRRTDDWRLMATRLDLRGALLGKRPCPADDVWVRDSDIIIVPKSPILLIDDFINLVFTRGVYGVVPFQGISVAFAKASTI